MVSWPPTISKVGVRTRASRPAVRSGRPPRETTTCTSARSSVAALGQLARRPEVDAEHLGAIGFCLGGSIVLTWSCTDNRLAAIAPFYGAAPKPREAIHRTCPVVGSWPDKDFTTKAAGVLETELTAAGVPHDLKVYPGAKHAFFNDQWRNYDPTAAADS